jgi:hypothetical protein
LRCLDPKTSRFRGAPLLLVSRAQRSTISAFTRVFARYGGALLNRDRYEFRVWDDPGSAAHCFTLRRVRETFRVKRHRSRNAPSHSRHCEEPKRRSNPERRFNLDCFASLRAARNDEAFSRRAFAPEL